MVFTVIAMVFIFVCILILTVCANGTSNENSAFIRATRLVKEGKLIADAVREAERDQVAAKKVVVLSIDDLTAGGYLQAIPDNYVTMKADALSATPEYNFDFAAGKRVFINGVAMAYDVCQEVNKKAGFTAANTASPVDTDTDLVVSVATDAGSKVYGCDTTTKKVFYNF